MKKKKRIEDLQTQVMGNCCIGRGVVGWVVLHSGVLPITKLTDHQHIAV